MLATLNRRRNSGTERSLDDLFNMNFLPSIFNFNEDWDIAQRPAVNIEENDREYVIEVATPGLDKKDISIHLDQHVLSIASNKEVKKENKQDNYLCREFNYSSFSRSFTLPEDTDSSKIKATHKNGILNIVIPKNKAAQILKEIKIN
jgi:HSP20 family protein